MLDGAKLKFLRYMHGKTQKQVADWCDVNLRFVKGVEANEYNPSQEVYEAWLNCVYGIGEPIKREKPVKKVVSPSTKKRTTTKNKA